MNADSYFATLPPEELLEHLVEKIELFDRYLDMSGIRGLWRRSSDTYYKGVTKSFLEEVGEQGEFVSVFVGHYRNILKHVHTTTTSARPAFEPEASNTDYASRAQVQACSGLLDYYFVDKKYERQINRSVEGCLIFGEYHILEEWDSMRGDFNDVEEVPHPIQPEPVEGDTPAPPVMMKRPVYEGDVRVQVVSPNHVIRDISKETFDDLQWVIVRTPRNRWDLIAEFPEHRDVLVSLPSKSEDERYDERLSPMRLETNKDEQTDDVWVYTLFHDRTPAVPLGRVVRFVDDQTWLSDETMEQKGYHTRPLYRIAAGDIEGAPFGYTSAFDLLALIELCNLLYSTIATNQSNFGVQSIQCPAGAAPKATQLTKGLTLFEYATAAGKLEPLQLTSTPAEIFKFIEMVERLLETLSGVNSVARGNPEASLKSGAALALVQTQHIEFTKDLQLSYAELVREVGTGLVKLFQRHATSKRIAAIAGRAGRTHLKALAAKDISGINRVTVNMGNHLARTPAGRYNLAEQLTQAGLIKTPEQLLAVLETGKIEPATGSEQATLDLIANENEEILDGRSPAVLITDDHLLHIKGHASVGADVEARRDDGVMNALTAHQMEHLKQLAQMPPELAQFLGQPVLQQPLPPSPEGPGAPGAPATGETPPEAPSEGAPIAAPGAGSPPAGKVAFPQNPVTGQQWTPSDGGSPAAQAV